MTKRRAARGMGSAMRSSRSELLQPIQMPILIDQLTASDGHHFVNAVRELVTTVLDMDHGVPMGPVAPVDVCDTRHIRFR